MTATCRTSTASSRHRPRCGQPTLEPGATYELRLAAVAVSTGVPEPPAAYLTDITGSATAIPENGSQQLVVEARDRFDNPVSGVAVTGSVSGDGSLRPVDPTTNIDGQATFVYDTPESIDGSQDVTVTLAFGGGGDPQREATFTVRVMEIDGSGSSNTGTAPAATITNVDANTGGAQDRYRVSVDATDPDGDLDRVEFELRDPDTETVIDSATASVSDGSDSATERLTASSGDRFDEYRIVAIAVDRTGNTGSDDKTVADSGS